MYYKGSENRWISNTLEPLTPTKHHNQFSSTIDTKTRQANI